MPLRPSPYQFAGLALVLVVLLLAGGPLAAGSLLVVFDRTVTLSSFDAVDLDGVARHAAARSVGSPGGAVLELWDPASEDTDLLAGAVALSALDRPL